MTRNLDRRPLNCRSHVLRNVRATFCKLSEEFSFAAVEYNPLASGIFQTSAQMANNLFLPQIKSVYKYFQVIATKHFFLKRAIEILQQTQLPVRHLCFKPWPAQVIIKPLDNAQEGQLAKSCSPTPNSKLVDKQTLSRSACPPLWANIPVNQQNLTANESSRRAVQRQTHAGVKWSLRAA